MSDKTPYLGNPQKTIEVIQKYEFAFQKKFGQNFLIDTHVLDKIISAAEITKDDRSHSEIRIRISEKIRSELFD